MGLRAVERPNFGSFQQQRLTDGRTEIAHHTLPSFLQPTLSLSCRSLEVMEAIP
jgi:hypothetical protein